MWTPRAEAWTFCGERFDAVRAGADRGEQIDLDGGLDGSGPLMAKTLSIRGSGAMSLNVVSCSSARRELRMENAGGMCRWNVQVAIRAPVF
jgi:hypothetical protein